MRRSWALGGVAGLLLGVALPCSGVAQQRTKIHAGSGTRPQALTPLTHREQVEQMLDRFTYGPRPGELDRVLAQGGATWFEQQLNPSAIPDVALNRRLADLPTVAMTPGQALAVFPDRRQIAAVADDNAALPTDPLQRAVMEVQVARYNEKKDRKKPDGTVQPAPELTDGEKSTKKAIDTATAARVAGQLLLLPREAREAALIALPLQDRLALTGPGNLPGQQRDLLLKDCTPRDREAYEAMATGGNNGAALGRELEQAHMLRDILSERQLETVMTDLWFNHFNVFLDKGPDRWYTASYERDVIRPHALGKFGDLLLATATSPAMMVYLDNLQSVGPDSQANGVNPNRPSGKRGNRGLNENYGREVMELHTVGVNGGYSQADVTALAAILTGWGVDRPQDGGPFVFEPRRHEPGAKAWFGHCISDDGHVSPLDAKHGETCEGNSGPATQASMQQGIAALKLLAASPQTAHSVAGVLAQYFVADTPPAALVDRLATVYLATDGDIKAMLRSMLDSPEFNSRQNFRTKVKTPVEFLASAYRSTGTDPQNVPAIVNQARTMGMPLYGALPPTGYYLTAEQWMNSTALVDRLNFAYQLTGGKLPNQPFDGSRVLATGLLAANSLPPGVERSSLPAVAAERPRRATLHTTAAVESPGMPPNGAPSGLPNGPLTAPPVPAGTAFATQLLAGVVTGGPVSPKTRRLIETEASQPVATLQGSGSPTGVNLIVGLLLGSPEFQLR